MASSVSVSLVARSEEGTWYTLVYLDTKRRAGFVFSEDHKTFTAYTDLMEKVPAGTALDLDMLQAVGEFLAWAGGKVTELTEVDTGCSGIESAPGSPELDVDPDTPCPVCGNPHSKYPHVVSEDGTYFWPGHEYIIRTKTSQQKYPREWRMGYLGFGSGMEFSARGPDRTHGGQYGGTQTIGLEMIVYAKEVTRDVKLRYVGKLYRPADK